VDGYADDPAHGVDVAGLVAWARTLVVRIEQDGLARVAPTDLIPHLRR
jgi:hypothetical protein